MYERKLGTEVFLMIDSRAKNMFLTYWGKKDENGNEIGKWEPWFYDNDESRCGFRLAYSTSTAEEAFGR